MKLSLFTPVFGRLSFVQLLDELRRYPEIRMLELGTGGWPGSRHIDLDGLLGSRELVHEYRQRLQDAGLGISALSCHGNPLHPVDEIAQRDHEIFRKTLKLANLLEVPVVITFSGCPGGSPGDRTPNWITTAWPPEYADALAWQWESKVVPYWTQAANVSSGAWCQDCD